MTVLDVIGANAQFITRDRAMAVAIGQPANDVSAAMVFAIGDQTATTLVARDTPTSGRSIDHARTSRRRGQ